MSETNSPSPLLPPPLDASPKPLTVDEIQRLIGSLFLEIDYLRRQNAMLREQLARYAPTELPQP